MLDDSVSVATGATDESGLIMGKVRPPEGLLIGLRKIRQGAPLEKAVLLVFSKDIKGRLLILNNNTIVGANLEPGGETGIDAANQILKVERGMFGFRSAIGNECDEVSQALSIDIDELLIAGGLGEPQPEADSAARDTASDTAPASAADKADDPEADQGYLEWLQSERAKVFADLERSLSQGAQSTSNPHGAFSTTPSAAGASAAASSSSPLAKQDAPAAGNKNESARLSESGRWQGLESIPTPNVPQSAGSRPEQSGIHPVSGSNPSIQITDSQSLRTSGRFKKVALPEDGGAGVSGLRGNDPMAANSQSQTISFRSPEAEVELQEDLADLTRRKQVRVALTIVGVLMVCGFMNYWVTFQDVENCLTESNKLFNKKDYKGAIFLTSQALEKDKNNPRLHMQKGLAHARLEETDLAIAEFDAVLKHGGPRLTALLARATVYLQADQFDKAVAECQAILLHYPTSAEAYLLLATAYEQQHQPELALKACTKALEIVTDPGDKAKLLLERGFAYSRLQKPAEAEKDLSSAINLKATPAMYMARGDVYKKMNKHAEALADYKQVTTLQPDNYNAFVARGLEEVKLHRDDAALKSFGEAVRLNKHGVEALIQRGSLYLSRGSYQLAVNDLEDALKLNPRIAETQQKLDAAHKNLRTNIPRVTMRLEDSRPLNIKLPSDPNQLHQLGVKYLQSGELDHAIMCLAEAVKKQPNSALFRRSLAHAFYESGDSGSAAAQFEALNSLGGIQASDAVPMAQSLARSNRRARAIQVLETWLAQMPRSIPYRYELANLYFAAGNVPKARETAVGGLRGASPADRERLQDLIASFSANSGASAADARPNHPQSGQQSVGGELH